MAYDISFLWKKIYVFSIFLSTNTTFSVFSLPLFISFPNFEVFFPAYLLKFMAGTALRWSSSSVLHSSCCGPSKLLPYLCVFLTQDSHLSLSFTVCAELTETQFCNVCYCCSPQQSILREVWGFWHVLSMITLVIIFFFLCCIMFALLPPFSRQVWGSFGVLLLELSSTLSPVNICYMGLINQYYMFLYQHISWSWSCLCWCYNYCDRIPKKRDLKGGQLYSASQL